MPPGLSFREVLEWFARRVASSLGHQLQHVPGGSDDALEDWLACAVPAPGAPAVILIDEASTIRDQGVRNAFYGQIRALKSTVAVAPSGSLSSIVQFAFAGTFRPETMVDERNSPFNVCRRVDTEDLYLDQIKTLAGAAVSANQVDEVSNLIYGGVGSQPHLAQILLTTAANREPGQEAQAVITELERLASAGNDHLDSLFRVVVQDPRLARIASAAAAHGRVDYDPANVDYRFMIVVGLMRREAGQLVFRNPLYERIARSSPQLRPEASCQPEASSHFYLLEDTTVSFIADSEFREICCAAYNGAVTAINAHRYRLALIGFGIALEAILLDWMLRRPAPDIATAIAAASSINFTRYEDRADPSTWRLVNLMKVARQLNGVRGPLELPEPLRQLRNFVHPSVMKVSYLSEPKLVHEAIAAGGLVGGVMRDIQTP